MMSKMRCLSMSVLVAGLFAFGVGCQMTSSNGNGNGNGNTNNNGNNANGNSGSGNAGGNNGDGIISVGEAKYTADCQRCHAVPGSGMGNAPDLAGASANLISQTFAEELHQDLFPQGLTQQEINELAAYLGSF